MTKVNITNQYVETHRVEHLDKLRVCWLYDARVYSPMDGSPHDQAEDQVERGQPSGLASSATSGTKIGTKIGTNSVRLIPYEAALIWQRALVAERCQQPDLADVLLLLEHPPVYTLGQGASLEFVKFDPIQSPYPLVRVERGGEVTYHCPGQIVAYPILNLKYYQQDLHWYLRQLEEVIIQVLRLNGLTGERIAGMTGVWIEGHKVAAIGIKVSRWITMHGFALNVCPDLSGFEQIVPCGIEHRPVGSLAQFAPTIDLDQVYQQIAVCFADVFKVDLKAPESKSS